MRRRPVLGFFLLALGLSWAGWIPFALAKAGLIDVALPAELIWAAEYGPTLAAIVMTAWLDGRPGLAALFAKVVRWRVHPAWYLLVLALTPVAATAVTLVAAALGRAVPALAAFGAWQGRFVERTASFEPSIGLISGLVDFMRGGPVQTALIFALLAVTNGGVSEEIGWRGFAQPRLQRRRSVLTAAVIVGILWALWHTGTAFWQVMLTADAAAAAKFAAGYLLQYTVLVVPLAIIYAWVVDSTGSLLLAILLHASYNMTIIVFTAGWPEFPLGWLVALLWLIAAAVAFRLRRSPEPAPA